MRLRRRIKTVQLPDFDEGQGQRDAVRWLIRRALNYEKAHESQLAETCMQWAADINADMALEEIGKLRAGLRRGAAK